MNKLSSTEIREKWRTFFEEKGHKIFESAPLIPHDDASLLFVNAGVTPLKKYFDGSVVPESRRIVSIQKCIRTNDVENVGVTKRHLTFFEMMGNFSVGDYFKEEAIGFSFEFLTSPKWMGIPKEKIYVTVYPDDEVAIKRWVEVGLDETHIARLEGNFWEIGEGPCGPDSEIFYDRGEEYDPNHDALDNFMNDRDQERFVEIWNNVFSQYNSKADLDRSEYPELPNKNIDTGAGLERWATIFQNVDSVFETDLFAPIIEKIAELTETEYNGEMPYKVIADHIRAVTMALTDGGIFENTGRGYVLRRLLRRSVRMGKKLGMNEPFIYKLVDVVAEVMGKDYPDVIKNKGLVKTLVLQEEELFHKTLASGERKLYQLMKESKDKTISGYDAFKLYDTYGFPFELTLEYLQEEDFTVSREEFDKYMEEARRLSKESHKSEASMNSQNEALLKFDKISEFTYDETKTTSKLIAIFDGEKFSDEVSDNCYLVFDKTCFYATSGGQVADTGVVTGNGFKAEVIDVISSPNLQHLHKITNIEGFIKINDELELQIDEEKRNKTACNHSSIHIIQKTLQELFSDNIHQAGSYVDNERLRFDFTYTGKISDEDIVKIEELANEKIKQDVDTEISYMSLQEAKEKGAMALFSEKYKDVVRVVKIGDSLELCGGTHIKNTNEISALAILKLESKGSNVYRIEATTNENIKIYLSDIISNYLEEVKKLLEKAKSILDNAKSEGIELEFNVEVNSPSLTSYKDILYCKNQLSYVQTEVRNLEKKYNDEKIKKASSSLDEYLACKEDINGHQVIIMKTNNIEMKSLKGIVDALINNLGKGLVFIANVNGDNVNYVCSSRIDTINAGDLVKQASGMSDGNGGGSPTFAQGGGKDASKVLEVLEFIKGQIV